MESNRDMPSLRPHALAARQGTRLSVRGARVSDAGRMDVSTPVAKAGGHGAFRGLLLACLTAVVGAACLPEGEPSYPLHAWALEDGRTVQWPTLLDAPKPGQESYVLRSTVTISPDLGRSDIALSIPLLESSVELVVDGVRVVPHEQAEGYRRAGPHRWSLPAETTADGVVALELRVARTWRKSQWLAVAPRLHAATSQEFGSWAVAVCNVYGSWLALGALVQVALTCLLVYALDRRRVPYLWFGVQAMSASVYPLFASGLIIPVLGTFDLVFMELGLVVALTASLFFTHRFFELGPVPRWLLMMMGVSTLVSIVIHDPYLGVDVSARAVVLSVTTCIVYQLLTIGRLWWSRRHQRLSLALLGSGWLALAGTTWCDLIHWFTALEPLGGVRPACFGLAVFSLFLSLLLSRSHILSLAQADALNTSLAHQVQEVASAWAKVEATNVELRRQIADRSGQLFAALSLMQDRSNDAVRELPAGTLVNGRYRVEDKLGAGAMGAVYRVTRITDDTTWAMKVAMELQGPALARLAREAHILSRLRHVNIVQIVDIDVATNGFMFVVLEYVEGTTLRAWLQDKGPAPLGDAVPVLAQIARGLAALHEANVAHRDLKPDNVLLTSDGAAQRVKIADFGISRLDGSGAQAQASATVDTEGAGAGRSGGALGRSDAVTGVLKGARTHTEVKRPELQARPTGSLIEELGDDGEPVTRTYTKTARGPRTESATRTGSQGIDVPRTNSTSRDTSPGTGTPSSLELTGVGLLSGTPHYIAPELALGAAPSDVRADLFSFGVLAYELLCGHRPFKTAVAVRLFQAPATVLEQPEPLPPGLERLAPLIVSCLSFKPEERPTATQAADFLEDIMARAA